MGKVELQKQIHDIANDVGALGGCVFVECPDGGFDLIEPETVQLFSDHVEAHDLDGTKVQIPYTTDDKAAIKEAIEEFGICTSAPGKQILQKGRDPEHEKGEHKYTE